MSKKVYVAGPMSWGSGIDNIRQGVEAATELLQEGYYPYLPHLSHFWGLMLPADVDIEHSKWLEFDREWLIMCDALIRLPGKSRGADKEERWARRHSIPVYYGVKEFLDAKL